MKKSIVTILALALTLGGCSKPAFKEAIRQTTDYKYVFSTDVKTFDYITTGYATDSDHLTNFVDGMLEQDPYGQLVGALAESYEVNETATVFTFHLKKGVNWVTADGEKYAEVKADDFVAGLQHAIDFKSSALYIVQSIVKGLQAYLDGVTTDFSTVGVKAIDDYTVQYTLTEPTPYFHTMTTYGVLYPVNREFLESKGTGCKLGAPDTGTCTFGTTDSTGILFNGAYLLTNYTAKSVLEYKANEDYYDKENVHIQNVKLIFADGSDPDSYYRGYDNGSYTQATIYTDNQATYNEAKKRYGDSIFASKLTSTSFYMSFNLDRNAYASSNNPDAAQSIKTDKQKADTKLAVLNENFRKAFLYAFDRPAYSAQRAGEDLKYNALRNTITMPDFVVTSTGDNYATLVAKALEARNPEWAGINLADGQDPFLNKTLAMSYANKAKEELTALGVDWPIVMECVQNSSQEKLVRQQQALKSSVESTLGADFAEIQIILTDEDNANYSDYLAPTGSQKNFDFSTSVGWGADYGDPRTYVEILDPDTGAILSNIGLDETGAEVGDDAASKKAVGFDEFKGLLTNAMGIITDLDARYAAFAAAEAWIIDKAILIPIQSQGGMYAVSQLSPYTAPYSFYGLSEAKMKYRVLLDHTVTGKEREALKAEWEKEMATK